MSDDMPNPLAEHDMKQFDRLPRKLRDALNEAEFGYFAEDFRVGRGRGSQTIQIERLKLLEAEMKRRLPVALPSPPDPR